MYVSCLVYSSFVYFYHLSLRGESISSSSLCHGILSQSLTDCLRWVREVVVGELIELGIRPAP